MKELLKNIIAKAALLGLPATDVANAQDFLERHEFGLCFDTITTQIYEYEIEIDNEFYQLVVEAAKKMNISIKDIDFIKELLS